MLSPTTTQSYRFGPDMGDESQICLFGGCLLTTYVPAGGKVRDRTPAYHVLVGMLFEHLEVVEVAATYSVFDFDVLALLLQLFRPLDQ